ncbi:MFS transporter, partial [Salmonella enterica subsp. enterica serovar Typhimurium]
VGAALFWPVAEIMNYTLFLIDLCIMAAGLGCSETEANPFVTLLGPESVGHFRLNLTQTVNSVGAIIAVVFRQSLILSNVAHQSQEALDKRTPEQLSAYK